MSEAPELTVVVPVFDEEDVLPALYERLSAALDATGAGWEILLVNDGSRDASLVIMKRLRARDPRVGFVNLARNFGHQLAVSAGMAHARGRAVVLIDADLQDPPELIGEMLRLWREGYDVVYGQRRERRGESLFKRASASLFYRALGALTAVDIPVDTGDFRLMSRRVVDAMNALPEHHRFIRGLVAWVGFRQIALPYDRAPRQAGETKYPLRKMLRFAADATVAFSFTPLRVATALGFVISLSCFVYAAYAVYAKLVEGSVVSGWTSLMVAVLFLGGVQLLCLGAIGEYLGRVYEEVKGRPLYLVERVEQGDPGDRPESRPGSRVGAPGPEEALPMNTVWYFAYGSNLDPERFRSRIGPWRERRAASLPGHRVRFSGEVSAEGGGGAVLVREEGATAPGALFLIDQAQLEAMDAVELDPSRDVQGRAERRGVEVETSEGPVTAEVYLLPDPRAFRAPSAVYLNHIVRGLRDVGHGEEVVETLTAQAASEPD
jgi:dolichol-phosphate mannosyltransferase